MVGPCMHLFAYFSSIPWVRGPGIFNLILKPPLGLVKPSSEVPQVRSLKCSVVHFLPSFYFFCQSNSCWINAYQLTLCKLHSQSTTFSPKRSNLVGKNRWAKIIVELMSTESTEAVIRVTGQEGEGVWDGIKTARPSSIISINIFQTSGTVGRDEQAGEHERPITRFSFVFMHKRIRRCFWHFCKNCCEEIYGTIGRHPTYHLSWNAVPKMTYMNGSSSGWLLEYINITFSLFDSKSDSLTPTVHHTSPFRFACIFFEILQICPNRAFLGLRAHIPICLASCIFSFAYTQQPCWNRSLKIVIMA